MEDETTDRTGYMRTDRTVYPLVGSAQTLAPVIAFYMAAVLQSEDSRRTKNSPP
jgi:hypothetical protein